MLMSIDHVRQRVQDDVPHWQDEWLADPVIAAVRLQTFELSSAPRGCYGPDLHLHCAVVRWLVGREGSISDGEGVTARKKH